MTLDEIAIKHGTDKSSKHHGYAVIYDSYFRPFKDRFVMMIELGVGGYEYIDRGGGSLKMWAEYFGTSARIIGIDVYKKVIDGLPENVLVLQGSQEDQAFLIDVIEQYGCPEIIIDDASHVCDKTIRSFEILFPTLAKGGIYVVEDIESSWADGWARGCTDYTDFDFPSTINFFRQLLNDINAQYIGNYQPIYSEIASIHFHKNIIFIRKR